MLRRILWNLRIEATFHFSITRLSLSVVSGPFHQSTRPVNAESWYQALSLLRRCTLEVCLFSTHRAVSLWQRHACDGALAFARFISWNGLMAGEDLNTETVLNTSIHKFNECGRNVKEWSIAFKREDISGKVLSHKRSSCMHVPNTTLSGELWFLGIDIFAV